VKLGSGSSSSNEDVSRYQPFTQYCLRRENRSRTSGYTCTRLCTAQTYGHTTHTWVGRRELAREWRVEMVLHRATSRPRWCRLLRRNMLSSCSRDRYVLLAESTRSRHDIFTSFVRLRAHKSSKRWNQVQFKLSRQTPCVMPYLDEVSSHSVANAS